MSNSQPEQMIKEHYDRVNLNLRRAGFTYSILGSSLVFAGVEIGFNDLQNGIILGTAGFALQGIGAFCIMNTQQSK